MESSAEFKFVASKLPSANFCPPYFSYTTSPKDCMSVRRKSKQPRLRNYSSKTNLKKADGLDMSQPRQPMAVTSGLNAIHIAPRMPKTPRARTGYDDDDAEEVELDLLDEEDRRLAAQGLGETEEQGFRSGSEAKRQMSVKDKRGMILLIILCEYTETPCHVRYLFMTCRFNPGCSSKYCCRINGFISVLILHNRLVLLWVS